MATKKLTIGGHQFNVDNFHGMSKPKFIAKYKGKLGIDISGAYEALVNAAAENRKEYEHEEKKNTAAIEKASARPATAKKLKTVEAPTPEEQPTEEKPKRRRKKSE